MRRAVQAVLVAGVVLTASSATAAPDDEDEEEADEPRAKKPRRSSPFGPGRSEGYTGTSKRVAKQRAAPVEDEEDTDDDEVERPSKPAAKRTAPKRPVEEAIVVDDEDEDDEEYEEDEEDEDDEEDEEDEDEGDSRAARAKLSARLDDDEDPEDLDLTSVTRSAPATARKPTRFYFRAGAFRQSSSLSDTRFGLETDLPIDTSNLGAGSGVEMQQSQIPLGMIIGYVLPVANRRLALETVLGFPPKSKFRATGALATESLAPTFMGMPTGIEPLGPELGEVTLTPPMLTAVYRIADLGPVTPIAGTGVMVLMARNAKITNPVLNAAGDPKLVISPAPGLVVQGGVEIRLWKRVAARIDVKYVLGMRVNARIEDIAVTPKAIPQLGSIEVGDAVMSSKVAPLVVQAGLGFDL